MATGSLHIDAQLPGLTIPLVGTGKKVRMELADKEDSQVIALLLPDGFSQEKAREYAAFVSHVGILYVSNAKTLNHTRLEAIVKILSPTPALSPNDIRLELMQNRARDEAWEGSTWLTARQLSKAAGMSDTNPSTQPNKWKREGRIFAVNRAGADYFPAYAIDKNTGKPLKSMRDVLAVFHQHKDEWRTAIWFNSVNSSLDGKRPCDMLLSAPERVVSAAKEGIQKVEHG